MTDSESNRRRAYRAAVVDAVDAVLLTDGNEIPIRIKDESAGGLGVLADCELPPTLRHGVTLVTADGLHIPVRVKYCEPRGRYYQIGLERLFDEHGLKNRRTAALRYALVLILGLAIGLHLQTDRLWRHTILPAFRVAGN